MTRTRESVENSVEKHHEIARKDLTKLHAIFVFFVVITLPRFPSRAPLRVIV